MLRSRLAIGDKNPKLKRIKTHSDILVAEGKRLWLFVNGLDGFWHPHLLRPVISVATHVPNCV